MSLYKRRLLNFLENAYNIDESVYTISQRQFRSGYITSGLLLLYINLTGLMLILV